MRKKRDFSTRVCTVRESEIRQFYVLTIQNTDVTKGRLCVVMMDGWLYRIRVRIPDIPPLCTPSLTFYVSTEQLAHTQSKSLSSSSSFFPLLWVRKKWGGEEGEGDDTTKLPTTVQSLHV